VLVTVRQGAVGVLTKGSWNEVVVFQRRGSDWRQTIEKLKLEHYESLGHIVTLLWKGW